MIPHAPWSDRPPRPAFIAALCLTLTIGLSGAAPALAQEEEGSHPRLMLTAGRSRVLMTDFDVTRIAITNPDIADAVVVQPREILVDGKAAGTVSLII